MTEAEDPGSRRGAEAKAPALVNDIAGAHAAADIVGIRLPSVAAIREAFEEEFLPSVRESQIVSDFLTSDPGLARAMSERAAALRRGTL